MSPRRPRRAARPRARASSDVVLTTLESYAKRGIFRGYGAQPTGRGRHLVSFRWHADAVFRIEYDSAKRSLAFRDVLPLVPAGSAMDRELRAFVRAASARTLPEHRRIDPRKATATVRSREENVSLLVQLKAAHLEYGVRRAVVLVHEVFVVFLRSPLCHEYMVERFNLPPDQ